MKLEETKIYLVSNCYGDPNKVYIGKTKNNRKADHRMKFGSQINYYYIDKINSIKQEDWEPLETKWIQYYISLGYEVLNKKTKGGSGPSFQTKEAKLKISQAKKGKPSPKSTFKKGKDNGHFGVKKNKEVVDKISKLLKGKPKSKEHISKMSLNRCKPIVQYDLENNFIKEWKSSSEAGQTLNISKGNITQCCKGKYKSSMGFIWKYKHKN